MQGQTRGGNHIATLDFLRGIAALSVVLFHYATASIATIKPNYLSGYMAFGKLGVQVFFVISGFIIPYSMYVSGYKLRNAGQFLLKRLIRIGPPAWLVIFLMIGTYYGAIYFKGSPIEGFDWPGIGLKTLLANLTFTPALLNEGLYMVVYWTLEVELQFYILMAILLPVLLYFRNQPVALSAVILAISFTQFINDSGFIFLENSGLFLMGMLLFLYRTDIISRNHFITTLTLVALITYARLDFPFFAAGLISLLAIAYMNFTHPVTTFLGKISYSLYITHNLTAIYAEFGIKSLTGNENGDVARIILLFTYTIIAIIAAYVYYQLVEKPSLKLSQKISWRKKRSVEMEVPVAGG